jgi:hypothetical protein
MAESPPKNLKKLDDLIWELQHEMLKNDDTYDKDRLTSLVDELEKAKREKELLILKENSDKIHKRSAANTLLKMSTHGRGGTKRKMHRSKKRKSYNRRKQYATKK